MLHAPGIHLKVLQKLTRSLKQKQSDLQCYLEDEGIKVEYVHVETDAEVFEGIKNGTIDVASNSGTNLPLQQIADGQDLTIFGGYLLTGCMPIFAKVDTKWDGIEDLAGKTMACEPNMYAVSGPLLDKGYDPLKDVKWYNPEDQNDRIKAVKEGKACKARKTGSATCSTVSVLLTAFGLPFAKSLERSIVSVVSPLSM